MSAEETPAIPNLTPARGLRAVPPVDEHGAEQPRKRRARQPINIQQAAVGLASLLGLFGGGAYAVSPWASSKDLGKVEHRLALEVKARHKADRALAGQLKAISEKLGVPVTPELNATCTTPDPDLIDDNAAAADPE